MSGGPNPSPDRVEEPRYPLGKNAKLDELMVLVAVTAASESGNGYDLDALTRHAKRATELWNARPESESVTVMREALEAARKACAAALRSRSPLEDNSNG